MDALQIFKISLRITWQQWRLWIITFLMFITFIPSLAISFSFSFWVQSFYFPASFSPYVERINPLYFVPEGQLTVLSIFGVALMVLSLSFSWIIQAAAMHITVKAVDGEGLTLRQAFTLGRERIINIIKISIVFGLIIAGIAYFPVLLFLFAPPGTPAELLYRLVQPILGPLSMVLNFVILLLLMAVALDKSSAQDSLGRAWDVFKSGWVRFIIVIVGTSFITIALTLLFVPLVLIFVVLFLLEAAPIFFVAAGLVIGPLILGLLIFQGVFSLVLYTVTYRASSTEVIPGLKALEVYGV
jgi:hypothetical protein